MSDEQPVVVKKARRSSQDLSENCIIHYCRNTSDLVLKPLTETCFKTIHEATSIRQLQTNEALRLDDICRQIPTDFIPNKHEIHSWCYKNFTNVSKLRKNTSSANLVDETYSDEFQTSTKSRQIGRSTILFPSNMCLFCGCCRKRKKLGHEDLIKCVTKCAESKIKEKAIEKQDFVLLGQIEGMDLLAREAHYHESCRRDYVRQDTRPHHSRRDSLENESTTGSTDQRAAYTDAFAFICNYVEQHIVLGGSVLRMTMLREVYLQFILDNNPTFYNPNHKTDKLKEKLGAHFGDRIQFWQPNYKSTLVYSSDINTGEAIEVAFEAATSENKILEDAAMILRRHIRQSHSSTAEMPWPPSASFLQSQTVALPEPLIHFMSHLLCNKPIENAPAKIERVVHSLAEDVCSACTNGRWKMPKHILLGVTLHHLTGSAEVITMLNRYGHCTNYSYVLELETAMSKDLHAQKSILPSNISVTNNKFIHFCWDNFDINEETPSGVGTTHTTHGIAVQEIHLNASTTDLEVSSSVVSKPCFPKTKARSLKYIPTDIPHCYIKKRMEPVLAGHTPTTAPWSGPTLQEMAWIVCRSLSLNNAVPDWSGWVSKVANVQHVETQSVVGYMMPLMSPITDCSTVQQCLVNSQQASKEIGQSYTFVTMDLAAAKIAYDIQWQDNSKFSDVIINLGAFHIMCSYMGSLGKMMRGSGFEEIIIEAGVCASGSIEKVMLGKHYNRAMRVHQHMSEAIQRMILEAFLLCSDADANTSSHAPNELSNLAALPNYANVQAISNDHHIKHFFSQLQAFMDDIRQGKYGKTAQFWLSYADCVWVLMRFQRAVKENDLSMYIKSLRSLCVLLFSSDHFNYARYLPVYYSQLLNLQTSHPGAELLLQDSGISVSRSNVPACRNAVDITIEQTINRSAKTSGGIIGFSRNISAYHRWCVTRHIRASYVEAILDEVGMVPSSASNTTHKTVRPSEIRRSEKEVTSLITAFNQFLNPFQITGDRKGQLYCLSSGMPASEQVTTDLLKYVESGETAVSVFLQKRFVDKTVKFQDPMKRLNLKTFKSMAATRVLTSTQKKCVQVKAERNLLGRLLMLSQDNNISLEKLFKYPLGPIPWSLATADGALVKTDKSQLLHLLEAKCSPVQMPSITSSVFVIDGNARFQALIHLPETFQELAVQILTNLPKTDIHFVTDTYKAGSIKGAERTRRGVSSLYLIGGSKTRLPRDFKSFLMNSENKKQLAKFILTEWQTDHCAPIIRGRQIYYVCEELCVLLESFDGKTVTSTCIVSLCSSQEEADTRIVLHCLHVAKEVANDRSIVVRSPDTDVFLLLLAYCARIQCPVIFETGTGNNRRLLDIQAIAAEVGQEVCDALPGFHAFTGCDCTSAFVRKGKKGPFKLLQQHVEFLSTFQSLGSYLDDLPDLVFVELERFVCYMYGKPTYDNVNTLRYDMFRCRYAAKSTHSKFEIHDGIDLSLIPPCRASLRMHCLRSNFQARIWRQSHIAYPRASSCEGNGWKICDDSSLSIDWIYGEAMPQQLIDVLASSDIDNGMIDESSFVAVEMDDVEEDCEVDNVLDVVFDDDDDDDDDED